MISDVLGRTGHPPFVLNPENTHACFKPSSLITGTSKSSLRMLFRLWLVRKRFARFLRSEARPELLLRGDRS